MIYCIIILMLFAGCNGITTESDLKSADTVQTFSIHISTFYGAAGYTLIYDLTPDSLVISYSNDFGREDTVVYQQSISTLDSYSLRSLLGSMALDTFQQGYEATVADGQVIGLTIQVNESSPTHIEIANFYLPDLFQFLDFVDCIIESEQYHIGYRENVSIMQKLLNGEFEGETMWMSWNGQEEIAQWESCFQGRCYAVNLRADSTSILYEPDGKSRSSRFTRQTLNLGDDELFREVLIFQEPHAIDTITIYKLTLDSMVTIGFPHISRNDTVRLCRVRE